MLDLDDRCVPAPAINPSARRPGVTGVASPAIRMIILDDHDVVRVGLASALRGVRRETGIELVGQARTADELEAVLADQPCDVVVLDLALGDGSDPAATVTGLVDRGYRVLVYSIADDSRQVGRTLAAGAQGLSRKSEPIEATLEKIRLVADGHVLVSQEILAVIDRDATFVEAKLSQREREVLVLYVSGLEVPQISHQLFITENSAKEYLRRIRTKYSEAARPAPNKVDLLRRAIEDGIVPPIMPH